MQTYLNGTLTAVEHGKAIISLDDGQQVSVAKELLHPLPAVGTAMSIKVMPTQEAERERADLAAELLNQVLGSHG